MRPKTHSELAGDVAAEHGDLFPRDLRPAGVVADQRDHRRLQHRQKGLIKADSYRTWKQIYNFTHNVHHVGPKGFTL